MSAARLPIVVEPLVQTPVAARRIELVERKGVGHPDTICDLLVEAIATALNRLYLDRAGRILHYNIDKALLVAGQCTARFGSGEMTRPMQFFIGDRATMRVAGEDLPVETTVLDTVDRWVAAHLPNVAPGRDLVTSVMLAPGSEELRGIFDRTAVLAANDTSGATGYAPVSPTESLVLAVEQFLNGADFKRRFPDTGQDVKVFATRRDATVSMTVAMPLLCDYIVSERAYFRRKEEILHALHTAFVVCGFDLDWHLNALDRPEHGTAGTYLTLTGTSAESADSGQVGRGNRANGVIALSRPTGGEATAGKNPIVHVGKIYSVLSHRLARLVYERCAGGAEEVYVHLCARIGEPVDRPWTGVQVVPADGAVGQDLDAMVRAVVEEELARLPEFQGELVEGRHPVC